jgi:hypothetical protein
MFVTNHALSGVVIGRILHRRPVAAFLAGVTSHLLLDAVPHWGCNITQPGGPERFLVAAKRDGLLGLTTMASAAVAVERPARTAVVAAMVGAVLLDLDKPLQHFFGSNPFPAVIQRIHGRVQNESPEGLPNELRFGFAFAVLDVIALATGRHGQSRRTNPAPRPRSGQNTAPRGVSAWLATGD